MKKRLDVLLVELGFVGSRAIGRRQIMAGEVLVDGRLVTKPSKLISADVDIRIEQKPRFVSRGGEKLAAALSRFQIDPSGWVCADVGSSTGGFTDCLLQAGAARVYAIDVGCGQLAQSLCQDQRVFVMEGINARYLDRLPEPVSLVCVDVSFISVRYLLPVVERWLGPGGQLVILVKPQFEAGRGALDKRGVVRDPVVHRKVLEDFVTFSRQRGCSIYDLMASPLRGPAGNAEFLLWLAPTGDRGREVNLEVWLDQAINEAHT